MRVKFEEGIENWTIAQRVAICAIAFAVCLVAAFLGCEQWGTQPTNVVQQTQLSSIIDSVAYTDGDSISFVIYTHRHPIGNDALSAMMHEHSQLLAKLQSEDYILKESLGKYIVYDEGEITATVLILEKISDYDNETLKMMISERWFGNEWRVENTFYYYHGNHPSEYLSDYDYIEIGNDGMPIFMSMGPEHAFNYTNTPICAPLVDPSQFDISIYMMCLLSHGFIGEAAAAINCAFFDVNWWDCVTGIGMYAAIIYSFARCTLIQLGW